MRDELRLFAFDSLQPLHFHYLHTHIPFYSRSNSHLGMEDELRLLDNLPHAHAAVATSTCDGSLATKAVDARHCVLVTESVAMEIQKVGYYRIGII